MNLSLQYRGPLSSCNYDCRYCPFAKRRESVGQLRRDREALRRFCLWLTAQAEHRWRILFTPWGEALIRSWYRQAICELSHVPQIESVAIQTNLSCGLRWVENCRIDRLSFWATYHPTEVAREKFVVKVRRLHERGVRLCVGTVGVVSHFEQIAQLRAELPREVYLWVNPLQPGTMRYTDAELAFLTAIDPLFPRTSRRHRSRNLPCRTGDDVFTVDGKGDMRRCHFVETVIGNIYQPDWESALQPRLCPNARCDCYLGYAHLPSAGLKPFFGEGLLERIPLPELLQGGAPEASGLSGSEECGGVHRLGGSWVSGW